MKAASRIKKISPYTTWYEFRKDLAEQLGYTPLNYQWLEIKPKAPLPWNDSHMREVISTVARLEEQKAIQKGGRHKRRHSGCEEWSDCYTCPIAIDECAVWYNRTTLQRRSRRNRQHQPLLFYPAVPSSVLPRYPLNQRYDYISRLFHMLEPYYRPFRQFVNTPKLR